MLGFIRDTFRYPCATIRTVRTLLWSSWMMAVEPVVNFIISSADNAIASWCLQIGNQMGPVTLAQTQKDLWLTKRNPLYLQANPLCQLLTLSMIWVHNKHDTSKNVPIDDQVRSSVLHAQVELGQWSSFSGNRVANNVANHFIQECTAYQC